MLTNLKLPAGVTAGAMAKAGCRARLDPQDLDRHCLDKTRSMGFAHFIFAVWQPRAGGMPAHVFSSNYPEAFFARYAPGSGTFFSLADERTASRVHPYTWRSLTALRDAERLLVEQARTLGLDDAITYPIHGPRGSRAVFVVSGGQVPEEDSPALVELFQEGSFFTAQAFDAALRLLGDDASGCLRAAPMSERQRAVLTRVAEGKSLKQIAQDLRISSRTAQDHLERCLHHLNVGSREQAVVKAYALGLIDPSFSGPRVS